MAVAVVVVEVAVAVVVVEVVMVLVVAAVVVVVEVAVAVVVAAAVVVVVVSQAWSACCFESGQLPLRVCLPPRGRGMPSGGHTLGLTRRAIKCTMTMWKAMIGRGILLLAL